MTIGSILLSLALLVLVGLFILQPVLLPEERKQRRRSQRQMLLAQKAALLEEVRALDFDHDTGKIPSEVYEPQRAELIALAADVLQKLDALGAPAAGETTAVSPTASSATDEIEQAIARLRQTQAHEIELAVAQLRQQPAAAKTAVPANGKTNFCPQCGRPVDAADKFCAACGHPLVATAV
jgi:rubrerythrin